MTSASIVGSTGLVGSHILSTLLSHPSISSVHSLSRRDPKPSTTTPKLHPLTSTDTSTWSSLLSSISPSPLLFFSALGTTKAQAGSIEAQRKIDHDLNLELASTFSLAADSNKPESEPDTANGKIYILVSTHGANASSMFPYPKMKGELENEVKALLEKKENRVKHVIILKPGLIVGEREDSRPVEFAARKVAGLMGWVNPGLQDFWAQDARVIGRAAVEAGVRALGGRDGKGGLEGAEIPRVWELGQRDIVRLGRTEWSGEE
ncbi:Bcfmp52 [Botrytis cinerea B05.10]|uniref:Bcfmp52 n=3 Tax=Botryotinia fuckeliana TaxID=40559 RepID=A0A384K101_BOTFB|nr:Bcfmp52 [Botrytis cinerea B05.10]ATZ56510.1 Bcfmp52 [Botrytis cinerea B05.10]EMR83871.1 putative nad dependent epimerase dehydratase family protein [Botrytis cinerea BcDW1]CCD47063.1 similar to NAD dependent epimerase/dehydratase family protein [Botrytis cinerea T4]